jgi:hypothetical protein
MKTFEYHGFTISAAGNATPNDVKEAKKHVDDIIDEQDKATPPSLQTKQWLDKVNSAYGHLLEKIEVDTYANSN